MSDKEVTRVKSGGRWWPLVILGLLAMLVLVAALFLPKLWKSDAANMGQSCNMAPQQVDSDSEPLRSACFVDLKEMTQEQKKLVVETGLQNGAVLRAWELCEAEINAVIDVQNRLADVYANFERPLPSRGYNDAALAQAATLAREAKIPCMAGATDAVHKARVTVSIEGAQHDAIVSDYDVMGDTALWWPVEYFKFVDKCATHLTAMSERVAAEVPDNFSRTTTVIAIDGQVKMLTAAGVTC